MKYLRGHRGTSMERRILSEKKFFLDPLNKPVYIVPPRSGNIKDFFSIMRQAHFFRNIDFIVDQQFVLAARSDLTENGIGHTDMEVVVIGIGYVNHMQQEIRKGHLFQRRLERFDERMRQLADKSYGVNQDELLVRIQLYVPLGGIQSRKEHVFLQDGFFHPCLSSAGAGSSGRIYRSWYIPPALPPGCRISAALPFACFDCSLLP